ncbi:MAG: regulatory protein / Methylated-DNA--protein-cysteine methyltransferase [Myxococcaceae bacterium]|nr:regulatory protein / Methylated-DNA--protein-cysteine methyltransferase [Myxococcaceae bacterium]
MREPMSQLRTPDPAHAFDSDDARYQAILRRDQRADGVFVYSVASTGVYCHPSCAARPALRKNVAFHASAELAELAGFRACKRCRPRELGTATRHAELIASLRAQLESDDAPKTLAALAERARLSPYYLQRLFKQQVGMTPRAYAAAHRLQRLTEQLREGSSVTAALYEAGYSSSSRFYEAESGALGIAPSDLRQGGQGVQLSALVLPCTLGRALVATSPRGVCMIAFADSDEALFAELQERFPHAQVRHGREAELSALAERIVGMIDAARFADDVPLDLIGTAFQQQVWRALRKIPRGQTCSYTELAERIGAPSAVRAVGSACGKNPVAALVPCHRVLRGDGSLGGYRWGLARKQALLDKERDP